MSLQGALRSWGLLREGVPRDLSGHRKSVTKWEVLTSGDQKGMCQDMGRKQAYKGHTWGPQRDDRPCLLLHGTLVVLVTVVMAMAVAVAMAVTMAVTVTALSIYQAFMQLSTT